MDNLDVDFSDLERKSSPLFDLFMVVDWYKKNQVGRERLHQAADWAMEALGGLHEAPCLPPPVQGDDWQDVVGDLERHLGAFQAGLDQGARFEDLEAVVSQLKDLDEAYLSLKADAGDGPGEYATEQELLELIDQSTGEGDVLTPSYLRIEEACRQYSNGELPLEDLAAVLDGFRQTILETRESYLGTYISPEEWTMESALGDSLLDEGTTLWLDALDGLQQGAAAQDWDGMTAWLGMAFEGNHKLYLVHRLKKFIDRACQGT